MACLRGWKKKAASEPLMWFDECLPVGFQDGRISDPSRDQDCSGRMEYFQSYPGRTLSTLHREDKLRCCSESKLTFLIPLKRLWRNISADFICRLGEVSAATPNPNPTTLYSATTNKWKEWRRAREGSFLTAYSAYFCCHLLNYWRVKDSRPSCLNHSSIVVVRLRKLISYF